MRKFITFTFLFLIVGSYQSFPKKVSATAPTIPKCFNSCDVKHEDKDCNPGCFCMAFGGETKGVCMMGTTGEATNNEAINGRCYSHSECHSNGGENASYCLKISGSLYGHCSPKGIRN
ncbi:hypothetical protein LIER_32076 [Lithospermum erythrorhizon]|uniref:Uncharacterized protein n=1 Tax=Lithospermum erythrorhizon TaxID=34254 RepID=A0AAV3RSW3_LITER